MRRGLAFYLGAVSTLVGSGLLLLNLWGLGMSLRSPLVDTSFRDFTAAETLSHEAAVRALDALDPMNRSEYATAVNRIIGQAMVHVPDDLLERHGLDAFHLRIPIWENYLLYVLALVKPDTYRYYELTDHRRALERGVGRCGQQSLAVVGYLAERGFETGFVYLPGHVVATARVAADKWYLLDPDYGVTIPLDIETAARDPARLAAYYPAALVPKIGLQSRFGSGEHQVLYGGPERRWARASIVERLSYVLKWALPALLLLPLGWYLSTRLRRPQSVHRPASRLTS